MSIDYILECLRTTKKSNYAIAKETGITQATIGNYVNGKTRPAGLAAEKLLKYFSNGSSEDCALSNDGDLKAENRLLLREIGKLEGKVEVLERELKGAKDTIQSFLDAPTHHVGVKRTAAS